MLRRLTAAVLSCAILTGGVLAVSVAADPPAAGKGGKGGPPGAKGSGKSKGGKGGKGDKGKKGPKAESEDVVDE